MEKLSDNPSSPILIRTQIFRNLFHLDFCAAQPQKRQHKRNARFAALASAIGDSRAILLKRIWIEPAVIWTAIVGESGTQKTPAFKYAARAVRTRQRRLMKAHAEAMQAWEADILRHQSKLAKWKKEATNKAATTEPPEAPKMPICPRAWIEDCTTEKLTSLLQENRRVLLILRDKLYVSRVMAPSLREVSPDRPH